MEGGNDMSPHFKLALLAATVKYADCNSTEW